MAKDMYAGKTMEWHQQNQHAIDPLPTLEEVKFHLDEASYGVFYHPSGKPTERVAHMESIGRQLGNPHNDAQFCLGVEVGMRIMKARNERGEV